MQKYEVQGKSIGYHRSDSTKYFKIKKTESN